jgi:hypothetical protein
MEKVKKKKNKKSCCNDQNVTEDNIKASQNHSMRNI